MEVTCAPCFACHVEPHALQAMHRIGAGAHSLSCSCRLAGDLHPM